MTANVLRRAKVKPPRALPVQVQSAVLRYVAASVPEKHKIATQRVLQGQLPRSAAIRIKCLQCCNYDRDEVRGCTVVTCALHPVRPYQTRGTAAEVQGADDEQQDE